MPTTTMMPFTVQFGEAAGADAIWWKTEESSSRRLARPEPPKPPTMSASSDQVSTV